MNPPFGRHMPTPRPWVGPVPGFPQPMAPMDGSEWFLVEITAVSGTGDAAVYAFKEINVKGDTGGGTEDRSSGRLGLTTMNPGRSISSAVFAVGNKALARRNVANVNEFELVPTGGGETWRAGKVTARSATPPPISYTVQPLKLDSTGAYVIDGATVTPCYRMPSKDYDETVLVEIPVDEGVLWREDPTQAGKYQLTPWGGLKKVVKKELIFTCSRCVETSPGVFEQITTNVYRKLAHFARDFRVTWKPPATAEGPIEADLQEDNPPPGGMAPDGTGGGSVFGGESGGGGSGSSSFTGPPFS